MNAKTIKNALDQCLSIRFSSLLPDCRTQAFTEPLVKPLNVLPNTHANGFCRYYTLLSQICCRNLRIFLAIFLAKRQSLLWMGQDFNHILNLKFNDFAPKLIWIPSRVNFARTKPSNLAQAPRFQLLTGIRLFSYQEYCDPLKSITLCLCFPFSFNKFNWPTK